MLMVSCNIAVHSVAVTMIIMSVANGMSEAVYSVMRMVSGKGAVFNITIIMILMPVIVIMCGIRFPGMGMRFGFDTTFYGADRSFCGVVSSMMISRQYRYCGYNN
jgi:hypothetical protein